MIRWFVLLVLGGCSSVAWAHSPIQGLDDFSNGFLHPLFVPAHVLLIFAFGLLLGQQGVGMHLRTIWVYFAGVTTGLVLAGAGLSLFNPSLYEAGVLMAAVGVALLAIFARRLPPFVVIPIGWVAGLLLGLDSLQDELAGQARYVALFGSAVSLYLLMLYPLALAEWSQRREWLAIGVRVVASWVAASALLVLALLFAPAT